MFGGLAGLVWLVGGCACNQVYLGSSPIGVKFFSTRFFSECSKFFYRDSSLSTGTGRLATAFKITEKLWLYWSGV